MSQTLNESFDGTVFPPTGWSNTQVSGSGLWARAIAGTDPVCAPHSGAGMAHYNSYNFQPNANALLISPPLAFSGSSIHELSFWKYGDSGWLIYNDSLGVYYSSSPNLSSAIHLATIPRYNPIDGWYKHSFILPQSLTGTIYIIFRGYSQYGNNMFLDDVSLAVPPTDDVSALSVDNPVYLSNSSPTIFNSTLKNTGLNSETFNVSCEVSNYSGNLLFSNTQSGISLPSWGTTTVSFDPFTLPNAESIYKVKIYTSLAGDLNHSNDTIEKTFYTYTHERQFVLLEVGTGTWCQYCPGAALGADDLVTNGKSVAVVENHNGDTYTYAASDARNNYYAITGYPTAIFDGIKKLVGGDHTLSLYTSYLPIYESRIAIRTAFGLSISGNAAGNTYTISLNIDKYGETPFADSNLVVHLALTQSNILENWQGQTHLEYVSRAMSPDANGTSISFSTSTQINVPLSITYNPAWGGSIANHDFELVAWIQDLATKEVVATQKFDLANITVGINNPDKETVFSGIAPNPASNSTTISFYQKNSSKVSIDIYNSTGQLIRNLSEAIYCSGPQSINWDLADNYGNKVQNGLYLCKIKTGQQVYSSKILVVK